VTAFGLGQHVVVDGEWEAIVVDDETSLPGYVAIQSDDGADGLVSETRLSC
jgi:hypothetical protein